MSKLTPYRVSLHENKGDKFQIIFTCMAQDSEHAYEQAEDAYRGCELLVAAAYDAHEIANVAITNGYQANDMATLLKAIDDVTRINLSSLVDDEDIKPFIQDVKNEADRLLGESKRLYKSTITIYTDYDPSGIELDVLTRNAISGDAYCTGHEVESIAEMDFDTIEGVGEGFFEFFGLNPDEVDEDVLPADSVLRRLAVGDEVYWNDPDEGFSSGNYFITHINADTIETKDTVITLKNAAGSAAEVYPCELTPVTYMVHSPSEAQNGDGAGYWSNLHGWTLREDADQFTSLESRSLQLPLSSGKDAKLVIMCDGQTPEG